MSAGRNRRLFLALWPDPELRGVLGDLKRRLEPDVRGRAVATENLHVTLKFLGAVPGSGFPGVASACRSLPFEPFELTLDRLGYFPAPRVVWIGASETPEPLRALAEGIESTFEAAGFQRERRRFHAHCTLFRKASRRPEVEITPISWPVSGWALVESQTRPDGPIYTVLERFPDA